MNLLPKTFRMITHTIRMKVPFLFSILEKGNNNLLMSFLNEGVIHQSNKLTGHLLVPNLDKIGFMVFNIFFILKFSEFGFQELLFVIFLCLLSILNTFTTVIDEIIPFGSRKRQNFQYSKNFPIKSSRVGMKK